MFIRSLGNAFEKTRAALRFATIVQRRMSLNNEASAPARVPAELMRDAYAQATTEIAPTNRGLVRPEARSTLKPVSGQHMKPAG